jgi:C4-dicarboxylate transporter DctM subunit
MAPVIIIGGIMTGFFTPTEASVVVCVYALLLGFFYRDLKLRDLPEIFFRSITQSVSLLFIIAAANFFGWLIIHQKIPDGIITTLISHGATQSTVLWIIIGIVLTMGCFLEGNAIFLITLPIFMPIAQIFQIDLVNFGVVMTLLIMIGNLTPPLGMCLFAVDSFAKVGIPALSRNVWPYLIIIFIITLCIAFIPAIALFLPNLLMGTM